MCVYVIVNECVCECMCVCECAVAVKISHSLVCVCSFDLSYPILECFFSFYGIFIYCIVLSYKIAFFLNLVCFDLV